MNMTQTIPPDLAACDREQIARFDLIQSFGFLVALSSDWTIVRASANLESFTGIRADLAIGTAFDRLIDPSALHAIRGRLTMLSGPHGTERIYRVALRPGGDPIDLAMHNCDGLLVLEGEPSGAEDGTDAALLVRSMIARLNTRHTLEEFHRDAARQVRAITGFDKVMIYRFAADGTGEVIAESMKTGMESFLGLHYPASDIPQQARALYLRNPFRVIADVGSETIALLPRPSGAALPLDLSLAVTRAVSPIHIEYLRNMGVGASLSISIIVDGRLWGLIACHHNEPRLPSFVMRSAAELLGQLYALTLESRLHQADASEDLRARGLADGMIAAIARNPGLLSDSDWLQDALRAMIQCDGIAVTSDNEISSSGSVPTERDIKTLAGQMSGAQSHAVVVTEHLASRLPESDQLRGRASGMLAIPLSRVPRDYIMLFRRELIHEVKWGGNPEKPVALTDGGLRLSPRKSFASFSTLVRDRSRPFNGIERRVADTIRVALIEVILRLSDEAHKERKRAFERQELLIAELNHRVRNILALIRGLISQTGRVALDVEGYIDALSGRVQALARAHNQITHRNWGPAAIYSLFDDEIAAFVPPRSERFVIEGPAMFLQPQAFTTMALVIHELVTNSSKYGALSETGMVAITLEHRVGDGLYMKWRESGGQPVSPPRRRGFGSAIIEGSVPFELQGTAEVRYNSAGLEADFFIPEQHLSLDAIPDIRAGTSHPFVAAAEPRDERRERPLRGVNVLLLEDNMIVALEAEELLRGFGAKNVWTASTIAEAARIADKQRIEFAMLDINLGLDSSLDFATRFRANMTPHIFASGYGEEFDLGERHADTIIAKKPYVREQLRQAICDAMLSRAGEPLA